MRALSLTLAALLLSSGCMQDADYVASKPALNEAGASGMAAGASGTGGMGGASGTGGSAPPHCDPQVTKAFVLFSLIPADCSYATNDQELESLLTELVYTKPAPELTLAQAERSSDPLCMIADDWLPPQFRPLRWRYARVQGDVMQEDTTVKVICPRYCLAMRSWVEAQHDRVRPCLDQSGP